MAKNTKPTSRLTDSDDEKGEPVTAATLQDVADRLSGASSLYDQAAKQLKAANQDTANVRNMPQMRTIITKVENSASKAVIDVGISIKAKRRAEEALNAEADFAKKPRRKIVLEEEKPDPSRENG